MRLIRLATMVPPSADAVLCSTTRSKCMAALSMQSTIVDVVDEEVVDVVVLVLEPVELELEVAVELDEDVD